MRATFVCLLLVPLLFAAPAPRIKPNLLKNGSFEEGRKINSYFSIRAGGTDVTANQRCREPNCNLAWGPTRKWFRNEWHFHLKPFITNYLRFSF
jgi:hypothetical protein